MGTGRRPGNVEQSQPTPATGGQARQFVMHECLGRGGFGEVYRATMVSPGGLETEVAIKVLRLDLDPTSDAVSRLRDEGKLLAALRHPAILRAHDLALLDGRVALVTEFVDGADLHICTSGSERLGVKASIQVVESVAEALDAAWNRSIDGGEPLRLVHRDIKPSNIRLGSHGEVKLLDFGIARSDEVDREARTGTGSTVGSLAYMAPERFSRSAPGPEADIYALGCTLYECFTSVRFHEDPVPVEMFRLAATPEAHDRHLAERLEHLPAEAEPARELLVSMLTHDKAARPTAAEVARRCEALAEEVAGSSLKRWARERSWVGDTGIHGTFDGRTITEGSLTSGRGTTSGPVPTSDTASDTFAFGLEEEAQVTESGAIERIEGAPVPAAPASKGTPRWVPFAAAGATVAVVVLLLVAWFGGFTFTTPVGAIEGNHDGVRVGNDHLNLQIGDPDRGRPASGSTVPVPPEPGVQPVQPQPGAATAAVPVPQPAIEPAPEPPPRPAVDTGLQAPQAPKDPGAPAPAAPIPSPPEVPAHAVPEPGAVAPAAEPVAIEAPAPPPPPEPAPAPVPEMGTVIRTAKQAAARDIPLELRGPTGTFVIEQQRLVPAGLYRIWVHGKSSDKQLEVHAGIENYLECNVLLQSCSPKR